MPKRHGLFERPSKADFICCKQSCVPLWGPGIWVARTGLFTGRLLMVLFLLLIAGTAGALQPLEPVDTSSPRATMESFLALAEESGRRYAEYLDSPSRATYDAFLQTAGKGWRLLDLSQVPPAARREVAPETRVLLREVILRVELPDLAEIPDALAVKAGDEKPEPLTRWRIPGTEITIARVEEGPRAGEWLFTPDTVRRARSFYERARELPYQRPVARVYLIRNYQVFTGWMIPPAWVEALSGWANTPVLG